jgi:putative ABC transport system permease protein
MPNSNIGYTAGIQLTPLLVGESFMIGLIASVAACILPARYVTRKNIVDALRQNV